MSVRDKYMHILLFTQNVNKYDVTNVFNWKHYYMKHTWWNFQLIIQIRNTFMGWHNVISYYCLLEKILTMVLILHINCPISNGYDEIHNSNILLFFTTWMEWIQAIIQSMLSISHVSSIQINLACCQWCLTSILMGVTASSWGFQLVSQWLTGTVHFFKDKLKHMVLLNGW